MTENRSCGTVARASAWPQDAVLTGSRLIWAVDAS